MVTLEYPKDQRSDQARNLLIPQLRQGSRGLEPLLNECLSLDQSPLQTPDASESVQTERDYHLLSTRCVGVMYRSAEAFFCSAKLPLICTNHRQLAVGR